jgi:hypothetical protein
VPKLPLPAAAAELGIAYSTLHRRMTIVGIHPEEDEAGALYVDTDALKAAWDARPTTPRRSPRGGRGGALNVIIDKETREELDTIATQHKVSLGEVARHLIGSGLLSYYKNGRRLGG